MKTLKLWCVSDTHTQHAVLNKRGWLPQPGEYDVLIHSGDYSGRGSILDTNNFGNWLDSMFEIFKYIVFVPGNHDFIFQDDESLAKSMLPPGVFYLNNSGCEIEGFKFWGSPMTPEFMNWAFMARRGPTIKKYWDLIPLDTDVLVTHGPPYGVLDEVPDMYSGKIQSLGCADLLKAVKDVEPIVHVFGHIHEGYGIKTIGDTTFINAANMDGGYRFVNKPLTFTVTK